MRKLTDKELTEIAGGTTIIVEAIRRFILLTQKRPDSCVMPTETDSHGSDG